MLKNESPQIVISLTVATARRRRSGKFKLSELSSKHVNSKPSSVLTYLTVLILVQMDEDGTFAKAAAQIM